MVFVENTINHQGFEIVAVRLYFKSRNFREQKLSRIFCEKRKTVKHFFFKNFPKRESFFTRKLRKFPKTRNSTRSKWGNSIVKTKKLILSGSLMTCSIVWLCISMENKEKKKNNLYLLNRESFSTRKHGFCAIRESFFRNLCSQNDKTLDMVV